MLQVASRPEFGRWASKIRKRPRCCGALQRRAKRRESEGRFGSQFRPPDVFLFSGWRGNLCEAAQKIRDGHYEFTHLAVHSAKDPRPIQACRLFHDRLSEVSFASPSRQSHNAKGPHQSSTTVYFTIGSQRSVCQPRDALANVFRLATNVFVCVLEDAAPVRCPAARARFTDGHFSPTLISVPPPQAWLKPPSLEAGGLKFGGIAESHDVP